MKGCFDRAESTQDHGWVEMAHVRQSKTFDTSNAEAQNEPRLLLAQCA